MLEPPPLPELSGKPPVPRPVRRASLALALSIGAWLAFVLLVIAVAVAAVSSKEKHGAFGISASGLDMGLRSAARFLLVASIAFSFAGATMGFAYRTLRAGKAAGILGGILFVLWVLIFGAIVFDTRD